MRKFLRFIDKFRDAAKKKYKNFWSSVSNFISLMIFLAVPIAMGTVVYRGLTDAGKQPLGILSFVIVGMITFYLEVLIAPQLHDMHMAFNPERPEDSTESLEARYIKKKMPYFGDKFGKELFDKVTEKDKFLAYVYEDGHESEILKINEADKWISIDEQYFPLDLIYGYNVFRNEIYTVDGKAVKLSEKLIRKKGRNELKAYLEKRGCFRENRIDKAGTYYNRTFAGHDTDLKKADWARGRYSWEKRIANEYYSQGRIYGFTPFDQSGKVDPELFTRVFSKYEMSKVMMDARGNEDKLAQVLDFNRYANEYTLCNGVEFVKLLNDSNYEPGMDFLFDCLRDIDEACFGVAVSVLRRFPTDRVKVKLEERAQLAYESDDAMHLAGLLYLAKEMNVTIDYIENIKNGVSNGEAKKFIPEETQQGESVAFEIGGAAYQKQ